MSEINPDAHTLVQEFPILYGIEKNGKTKEVINPAVDPRDEVSFETKHVCILSSSSCSLLSTYYYVLTCFKVIPRLNILSTAFVI